jgi:hypothetical protein
MKEEKLGPQWGARPGLGSERNKEEKKYIDRHPG